MEYIALYTSPPWRATTVLQFFFFSSLRFPPSTLVLCRLPGFFVSRPPTQETFLEKIYISFPRVQNKPLFALPPIEHSYWHSFAVYLLSFWPLLLYFTIAALWNSCSVCSLARLFVRYPSRRRSDIPETDPCPAFSCVARGLRSKTIPENLF